MSFFTVVRKGAARHFVGKFNCASIASHDFGGLDSLYAAIQSKMGYLKILKFQMEKSALKLRSFSI
jgi:hypothetical protein